VGDAEEEEAGEEADLSDSSLMGQSAVP
jgi:hypothetical protein